MKQKLFILVLTLQLIVSSSMPLFVHAQEATVTPTETPVVTPVVPEVSPTVSPTAEPTANVTLPAEITPTTSPQVLPTVVTPPPSSNPIEVDDAEDIASDLARQQRVEARRIERQQSGYKEEGSASRNTSETSASVLGIHTSPSVVTAPVNTPPVQQTPSATIATGNATNTAAIITHANTNLSGQPSPGSGAVVAANGNGASSVNNGSATVTNTNGTQQNNSAHVGNALQLATATGSNTASGNTGTDTTITTGDANTSGTIMTAVNTNVDGVMVSEFTVADDHVGDIVLDFGAHCVVGCTNTQATIAQNGSASTNTADAVETNTTNTFQNNDAAVDNTMVLSAESGNNLASKNTGGDTEITTGDANVSANALTFANNNIAGNVLYGVVNIFGDLVGDILFPESAIAACCQTPKTAITGNGTDTANIGSVTTTTTEDTFQNNDAIITNNLLFNAQTGNNGATRNTSGDTTIVTGDTTVDANVLNVANTNLEGENMWLVLVNEAGNWIGKIIGAPENARYAGGENAAFAVDTNGIITVSENGAQSQNSGAATQTNTNTTEQKNTAAVNNTLDLRANTGGNQSANNTGGDTTIKTGDAAIVANLVNFVNNNITGNGKLIVTVVNVFGSWIGDFVSPGQKQATKPVVSQAKPNVGGSTTNASVKVEDRKTPVATPPVIIISPAVSVPTQIVIAQTVQRQSSTPLPTKQMLVKSLQKKVLGAQTNEKIRVNLAWILFIIPFAFVVKRFAGR